jgi:tripartite-type tricarboxylate transporter receptor subunit TctC
VAAPSRLASLPDMPTFAEVGLAPVNRMSFLGVSAPIGTPKDVLDKLNAAVRTDLADVAVKGRIEAAGAIVVGSSVAKRNFSGTPAWTLRFGSAAQSSGR